MRKTLKERFQAKVKAVGSGCHEWQGCVMPNGYGQISYKCKPVYAHRVAYELVYGPIDNGAFVLHSCDNRKCVNPGHLFLGTFDDNMADMVSKGRQCHGERNPHAKLNASQVNQIRAASGTHRGIAEQFGVSQALVTMIRNRQIWRLV